MTKTKTKRQPTAFGIALRRLRRSRELTQKQLAAKARLNRVTIAQYESGREQASPEIETVAKLAGALGVLPGVLLAECYEHRTIDSVIAKLLSTEAGRGIDPDEPAIRRLRALPEATWFNDEPTVETALHMILAFRATKPR
jgi:transcriptional regulator with XRE-family HTH domain